LNAEPFLRLSRPTPPKARDCRTEQWKAAANGTRETAGGTITGGDLHEQAVAHRHYGGNDALYARASLRQPLRSLPELTATALADDQTERLQVAPELIVDPNAHVDQLVSNDQQRLSFVRRQALNLHGLGSVSAPICPVHA
jgi:hypothetical protein